MLYPYLCDRCGAFDVVKSMSDAKRPEPCPTCGDVITEHDYAAKGLRGYVGTESNWTGGKIVPQLPANHPDYRVTSKQQMERVYKNHGISMETGHFVSSEAQKAATLPKNKRNGNAGTVVGGAIDF